MMAMLLWLAGGVTAGAAERAGWWFGGGGPRIATLEAVAEHIKTLPVAANTVVLAAAPTQVGHWRLVNRGGETITAASPAELKRALEVLALPSGEPARRLEIHLAEAALFAFGASLKDLPREASLRALIGATSYRVLTDWDQKPPRTYIEVTPRILMEPSNRALFDEALWQLSRPIEQARVRLLALEPGGPVGLSRAPKIEPGSRRPEIDRIEPGRLMAALGNLAGQTALITGRVEGGTLYFKGHGAGGEGSLPLAEIERAAEANDVDVIVVEASTALQPGARSWLWQRTEVGGIEAALAQAKVGDFLAALDGGSGRLTLAIAAAGAGATKLAFRPAPRGLDEGLGVPIPRVVTGLWSDVAGRVSALGLEARFRTEARSRELRLRLIPLVPSLVQHGYVVIALLGLIGWPVTRRWWQRVWPREEQSEYSGPAGYWAARGVRGVLFLAVFLPLAGPLAALWRVGGWVQEAVRKRRAGVSPTPP